MLDADNIPYAINTTSLLTREVSIKNINYLLTHSLKVFGFQKYASTGNRTPNTFHPRARKIHRQTRYHCTTASHKRRVRNTTYILKSNIPGLHNCSRRKSSNAGLLRQTIDAFFYKKLYALL